MLEKSKTPNRKLSDLLLDEVVAFCDNINDARHTEGAMKEESIDKARANALHVVVAVAKLWRQQTGEGMADIVQHFIRRKDNGER